MSEAMLGVWQSEFAGAFLYGTVMLVLILAFDGWRIHAARFVAVSRLTSYLVLTFMARLALFLLGVGVSMVLFERTGRFVVCLMLILSVPLGILTAAVRGAA